MTWSPLGGGVGVKFDVMAETDGYVAVGLSHDRFMVCFRWSIAYKILATIHFHVISPFVLREVTMFLFYVREMTLRWRAPLTPVLRRCTALSSATTPTDQLTSGIPM